MLDLLLAGYSSIRIALLGHRSFRGVFSSAARVSQPRMELSRQNSQLVVTLAYAQYTTFGQIASHVDLRYLLKGMRTDGSMQMVRPSTAI